MTGEDIQELKQEIKQLRDNSLPRLYAVIDEMKKDIQKILENLSTIHTRQSITESKIEPLLNIPIRQVEIETKVKTISGVLWGLGGLISTGIVGFFGWLFSVIIGKAPH